MDAMTTDAAPGTDPAPLDPPAPAAPRRANVIATFDVGNKAIAYSDGTTVVGSFTGDTATYLMLVGADLLHRRGTLAKIASDGPPQPRKKKPALTVRQQAVVNALIEASRKAEAPHTVETATARVLTFDKKALAEAHTDPLVIKHHRKLTGKAAPSLLELGA